MTEQEQDQEYQQIRSVISNAYYDARNAGRTMEQAADKAAEVVQAMIAGAVAGEMDRFADYLRAKADNSEGRVSGTYADGMRNAAVDVGLWPAIRDHWREQTNGTWAAAHPEQAEHLRGRLSRWAERLRARARARR